MTELVRNDAETFFKAYGASDALMQAARTADSSSSSEHADDLEGYAKILKEFSDSLSHRLELEDVFNAETIGSLRDNPEKPNFLFSHMGLIFWHPDFYSAWSV